MEAEHISLLVLYVIVVVALISSAKLPDKRVMTGYAFALLSLTVGVVALWVSKDLWPVMFLPGATLSATVLQHGYALFVRPPASLRPLG